MKQMLRLLFVVLCFSFSTAGGATVALFADPIIDGEEYEMITGKALLVEDGKITPILDA